MNLLNKTILILINSCHCCSHPTIACSGGSSQIPREQFPCPASLLKPRFALNYPYREVCWVHGCWASAFLWLLRKCFPLKKERVSGLQRMGSDHSLQWYFSNSQELSPLSWWEITHDPVLTFSYVAVGGWACCNVFGFHTAGRSWAASA